MNAYLFSYGTLQEERVQMKLFRRKLSGAPDHLEGYKLAAIEIRDEKFLSQGEQNIQKIAVPSGSSQDVMEGTVFELSHEELLLADRYEPVDYQRVHVVLRSGKDAWVYAGSD